MTEEKEVESVVSPEDPRADRFYMNDIWDTPTVVEITERLQAAHPKTGDDPDEDWPDEYFEALNAELVDLFTRAAKLAETGEIPFEQGG